MNGNANLFLLAMKILITGATGFLGNNLARKMLDDGHEVVTTVRPTSDLRSLDGLEVEQHHLSLTDSGDIATIINDIELIVHSAAMIQMGHSRRQQSIEFNRQSTLSLAQAARRRDIRMIHVSTVDTLPAAVDEQLVSESDYGEPKCDCTYVVSKRAAGDAFHSEVEKGLDGVTVCPGFMVGPYDWKPSSGEMMLTVARTPLLFAPGGGCSVVDVRDVADGIVQAIGRGKTGERYILGGENITYLDLWSRMSKIAGCRPARKRLGNWMAEIAGRGGDFVSWFCKNELSVNSAATRMGQMHHWYSSEKAINEIGYKVGDVDVAIEDAWNWFGANGYR